MIILNHDCNSISQHIKTFHISLKFMKILITGGAGFIGSHLVDAYIAEGHDVTVIDNLSTGQKKNLNPKAKFYELDIQDKKVEDIFKKHKFDIVNHHAAQMNVRISVEDPIFDAKSNILGLLNLLENSVRYKVKKFIYVSSGGTIYGDDVDIPTDEEAKKAPLSPYGISKITGEHYLNFYSKVHGLKYTTLRYSNVYGPRQNPKGEAGVISIFSTIMLDDKQPTIFGDGKQTRDYVYVKDIVKANILALTIGEDDAFNLATGKETDVNQLFEEMARIIGFKQKPIYSEARPGELERNCLKITKAKNILGWQPAYALKDGLKETIDWFKNEQ